MRKGIVILLLIAAILTALGLAGCTSRRIIGADDHATRPIMNFQTYKTTHYIIFPGSAVHEFWMCEEKNDNISCERACDGKTDISCPTATMNVSSNVR